MSCYLRIQLLNKTQLQVILFILPFIMRDSQRSFERVLLVYLAPFDRVYYVDVGSCLYRALKQTMQRALAAWEIKCKKAIMQIRQRRKKISWIFSFFPFSSDKAEPLSACPLQTSTCPNSKWRGVPFVTYSKNYPPDTDVPEAPVASRLCKSERVWTCKRSFLLDKQRDMLLNILFFF